VDETYIPYYVFGPVTDIDGNPSTTSSDCSTTYKMLPTRVILWYQEQDDTWTYRQLFLMLRPD